MFEEARLGGRRLHHAALRGDVAVQDRGAARRRDRPVEGADHVVVVDLRARDGVAERAARHRALVEMEQGGEARQQRPDAARDVEVLHQPGAGRAQVGDHRHLLGEVVEIVEAHRDAGAPRHRDEVDHRVGRAGERAVHHEGVLEGAPGQDVARA